VHKDFENMINLRPYDRTLIVFSAVLLLLSVAFSWLVNEKFVSDVFLLFVPFFFLICLLTRMVLIKQSGNDPKQFSRLYMGVTISRFYLYLAILLVYSLVFKHDAAPFIIGFFVFYILFTIFEVIMTYRMIHHDEDPKSMPQS
jgi:L-asparagine transporter-like permease